MHRGPRRGSSWQVCDWLSGLNCGDSTVWEVFQERVSPAPDVRAALSQVASSKDRIGIVYFTDYLLYQDRLKLLLEGPSEKAISCGDDGARHGKTSRWPILYLSAIE